MQQFSEKIIQNLRRIMQERNLKQSTVGDYADISESQFSRVMSGSVQLSLNQLAKIASGLNMREIDIITYPDRYRKIESSNESESEVLLQLKLTKEKKDQVMKILFGQKNIQLVN